ncbi:MAG TPA: ornithine carbamoyltransferase [Coriobacteriia bacterium]|nr:ornithine carbamoyltransferase [Coriobacteriia bacterium]
MQDLRGRDLLTLGEITPEELYAVLDLAAEQKRILAAGGSLPAVAARTAALVFMKPSLRTRVSFEVGCVQLGIHSVVLGPGDAFSRSETIHDTVKVLDRMVDAIVIRTFAQADVEEIALHASVPVVNALTDDYHPCQVLADLLTIREHKGELAGLKVAYVGDGNNMANTLMLGCALTGMHVAIGAPAGFEPAQAVVERARGLAQQFATGSVLEVVGDKNEAVAGADVVVTDTWASMGQEDEHAKRVAAFANFTVDSDLMASAAPGAIFMHCLPAHRGEEVLNEVIDAPCSVVFDEAENRLHAQRAWLSLVL